MRNFVKRCGTNNLQAKKKSDSRPLPHRTVNLKAEGKGRKNTGDTEEPSGSSSLSFSVTQQPIDPASSRINHFLP